MTAEIESDELPSNIAKELFELGLIHEVIIKLRMIPKNLSCFFQSDYTRVEQSIDKALNVTTSSPDIINGPSTPLLDVKKTVVVVAPAALLTAQALQNQLSTSSSPNGMLIDGNNILAQPMMFLPT
jgi:hypothetical protein